MTGPAVLGVIINPIAGIGGRVALHGSDGAALETARELGGFSPAPARMEAALKTLVSTVPEVQVLAAAGEMGGRISRMVGLEPRELPISIGESSAADTRAVARTMADQGVALIIFAGGDGTARDLLAAIGETVPILGVPAGVKMHSAVFALNPQSAGSAAAAFLLDPVGTGTAVAEIADLTSADQWASKNSPAVSIFGVAQVPRQLSRMQSMKSGSGLDEYEDLAALGREVAEEMAPDRLYLLGPGTTVGHVKNALGIGGSVLGVDATLGSELLCKDATEGQLYDLVLEHSSASLVLGVIGGQGFLLGRGNQQISGRVLAEVGQSNVQILASEGKLALLDPPVLRIDLDEPLSTGLIGYRRVRTRPRHSTVMQVVS